MRRWTRRCTPPGPGRGGMARRRTGATGLRAQERVPQGPARRLRRDRLDRRGDAGGRRPRRRERRGDQQARASTRPRVPRTTPPSWPRTSGSTTASCRSSRWSAFLASLRLTGIAEENLQARVRGVIWMGVSNQEGPLVLANSNKSEVSVGYSTIYGDSVGRVRPDQGRPEDPRVGAGPLAEPLRAVPGEPADPRGDDPQAAVRRAPSGPDRPGLTPALRGPGRDPGRLRRRRARPGPAHRGQVRPGDRGQGHPARRPSQWKRRQFAPGPKISPLAFGKDRRLPITSRWREEHPDPS